jgi:hypothetical protein
MNTQFLLMVAAPTAVPAAQFQTLVSAAVRHVGGSAGPASYNVQRVDFARDAESPRMIHAVGGGWDNTSLSMASPQPAFQSLQVSAYRANAQVPLPGDTAGDEQVYNRVTEYFAAYGASVLGWPITRRGHRLTGRRISWDRGIPDPVPLPGEPGAPARRGGGAGLAVGLLAAAGIYYSTRSGA